LVLLQNPSFANGLGLTIHVRTKIDTWWSFTEAVVVQIGEATLEVTGGKTQIPYWLNGVMTADMLTTKAALGDFPLTFKRINDHQSRVRVDLGYGNAVSIGSYNRFISVSFNAKEQEEFVGSSGMMGSFPGGAMVGRDGSTVLEDPIEFGQEWQVLATEPKLFQQDSNVQHPKKCVMPSHDVTAKQKRRLGESTISNEDAATACARVDEADRDACMFDVLATNDKGMAGAY